VHDASLLTTTGGDVGILGHARDSGQVSIVRLNGDKVSVVLK
jgi:hypothetical protein